MQKRILDILQNTQKVIIGKERVTKLLLTALLADGHVFLEDVPGTGTVSYTHLRLTTKRGVMI